MSSEAQDPAWPDLSAGFGAIEGLTKIKLMRVATLKGLRGPKSDVTR